MNSNQLGGGWSFILLQTVPMNRLFFNVVVSDIPTILGFTAGMYLELQSHEVDQ